MENVWCVYFDVYSCTHDSKFMRCTYVHLSLPNTAPPIAISLTTSEQSTSSQPRNTHQILTCINQGVPKPMVEWLVNERGVGSSYAVMESVIPDESNRYMSVLTLPRGAIHRSTYACVLRNEFGTSKMSIIINRPGTYENRPYPISARVCLTCDTCKHMYVQCPFVVM